MAKKRKTVKERVIDRLNKGFGLNIPYEAEWLTHQATGYWVRSQGAFSWYFCGEHVPVYAWDIGACVSATKALTWDRWIISPNKEIFLYNEKDPAKERMYIEDGYKIEKIDNNGQ